MPRQHSILIIDDTDSLPEVIAKKLSKKGYRVDTVHSVSQARDRLKLAAPPTFILADRILENGPIEDRELVGLCKEAAIVSAEVLVYTDQSNLSEAKQYEILNKGAYRVLNKDDVDKLRDDVDILIRDFSDRTDLTEELNADTSEERSKFITALIGADVSLSVLDDRYLHQYSKTAPELLSKNAPRSFGESPLERVGICQSQCWLAQRDQHPERRKCWGCTVAEVFKSGRTVEGLFLNRQANGSVNWVDVQSKPIKSRSTGNIIAVREGVTEASDVVLSNLTLERRLRLIAESLIRAGFGRARIYTVDLSGSANLVAAAAWSDNPENPNSDYFESIKSLNLGNYVCPYAKEAKTNRIGSFVAEWDPELGESPLKDNLGLQPPYFDVPIYRDDSNLHSWLSVDFVGMDEPLRTRAIADYGKKETLTWLREEYGREIRLADDTEGKPGYREKFETARRARFGIATARSIEDAIAAISNAFRDLLPSCRVSVRMKKESELQEFERLCWGKPTAESVSNFSLDDPRSLSVAVVKHPLPKWISNYPEYRRQAELTGEPVGYEPLDSESTAQIPLKLENIVLGTLSISSPKPIQWAEAGYKEPLIMLAKDIALVLRDLVLQEDIDRAMDERAAMIAYSVSVTADGLWRHWAQQRLSEVSAQMATVRIKLEHGTLQPDEFVGYLKAMSGVIHLIQTAKPVKDAHPTCSIRTVFSNLQALYKHKQPTPAFADSENFILEMQEGDLRKILMILLDNALWSIQSSDSGSNVTVSTRDEDGFLRIDVIDDGPGIPNEMRRHIFRIPVESTKGQGIGLLYARGAALQYGGDLTFTSHPGVTRFTLSLPLINSHKESKEWTEE
jgi:CheY-like chemotaxis protein